MIKYGLALDGGELFKTELPSKEGDANTYTSYFILETLIEAFKYRDILSVDLGVDVSRVKVVEIQMRLKSV